MATLSLTAVPIAGGASITDALVAAVQQVEHASSTSTLKPAIPDAEAFAQVLDADGDIVAGAPRKLRRQTVLTESQFREARRHRIHVTAETGPRGEHVRLLAGPSKSGGVVVVGTALEEVASAQHRLELALGLGLPLLAALVTLVGWFVAGAVLRPVQEMIEDAVIMPIVNPQLVLASASDITGMHYSACCNLDLGRLGLSG